MDTTRNAADEYHKIGAEAAKAGLQQVLHDEGFDMSKIEGEDRVTTRCCWNSSIRNW
jgi:hypothetical protein